MASCQGTSASGNTNRFSNASLLSISSVQTLLPEYNDIDTANPTALTPNRFSNASLLSLSSVRTLLPQYSATDTEATTNRFEVGGIHPHEFRYSYPIRPKKPWATLHLHTRDIIPGDSRSLQSRPRVPRFWSCDPVRGTVELDLDSPQTIQQISITLKGNIVLSSHNEGALPFLNRDFTVWDKSMGDPPQSHPDSNGTQKKKTDSRLASGQYTFPFSFPFPTQADPISDNGPKSAEQPRKWTRRFNSAPDESSGLSSSERPQTSDHPDTTSLGSEHRRSTAPLMPQTFMEKDIDPNVAYDISVRIVHGRFKASSKIKTNIAYLPTSEPPPASRKRRAAYEAGALVPCPMNDPEGWFALPTVTIPGVVKTDDGNSLYSTSVDCTLYIAQPLAYTRGSLIPCFITIHGDGVEVAHLFPSTAKPAVRLLRRVGHPVAELENQNGEHILTDLNSWAHLMVPSSDMNVVTHEVGRANWWIPPKDVVQGPNTRHFEGEIHLNPDLKPSCDFQLFRIEYAIELLSFQTANFTPEIHPSSMPGKGDNMIASNAVEIMMLYRQDEPIPTAYSELPETYPNLHISSEKANLT